MALLLFLVPFGLGRNGYGGEDDMNAYLVIGQDQSIANITVGYPVTGNIQDVVIFGYPADGNSQLNIQSILILSCLRGFF